MGSIPLPALDVQIPKPDSLLNNAAEMEQIRASRQQQQAGDLELQQKRMELADQQAMTQALHDWDGKDLNELPGLVTKRGGSAKAVFGLRSSIVDQKTKLMALDKDQLALEAQKHDLVSGALTPLTDPKQVPDEQLPGAIHSTVQDLVQRGLIDPQHAQSAAALAQMPPDAARAQIGLFQKGMMGQKAQIEQAKTESEIQKNTSAAQSDRFKFQDGSWYDVTSGQPKLVNGSAADPQQFHDLVDQIAPPDANRALNMSTKAQVDFALKQGRIKDAREAIDKAAQEVGAIRKETDPTVQAAKLQLAIRTKRAEQVISQGDPAAAGKLLADGSLTLSELKSRGTTPQFIVQATKAAQQASPGWNPQKADADFKVASSPSNVAFFGSAKSLTDKGGTLDQLEEAAKDIPDGKIPVFNSIEDAYKAATGSGPIAKYASILVGVADDYSKVMGGGQGSDTSRNQAIKLAPASASPEARHAAVQGIRGAVGSQIKSRIGKNTVLQNMYGEEGQQSSAPSSGAEVSATGPNGHKIVVRGGRWVDAQSGQPIQ